MSENKSSNGSVTVDAELCTATVDMGNHDFNDLRAFLAAEEAVPKRNALFVRFPARRYSEPMRNADELDTRTPLRAVLQQRGYVYHQYNPVTEEFSFYRWGNAEVECGIPRPFTAKLGITAILRSSNGYVCMVRENKPDGSIRFKGKWKYVSGAVDQKEDILTAAMREANEEVGLPLDAIGHAVILAGYHSAGDDARPADYMTVLLIDLNGEVRRDVDGGFSYEGIKMHHDPHEIASVDWLPCDTLRQVDEATLLNPEWNRALYNLPPAPRAEVLLHPDPKKRRVTFEMH